MSALSASALSSERRLAANRANALLSTGPTMPEGKAKSSLNAVKTGLTGRTVLLPSEDAAAYQAHVERFREELQPVGEREAQLVQSLADTQWRLDRIPGLEFGLFTLGRKRYADQFEEEQDPQVRAALLDAHMLMIEAKHFKNLHLQETACAVSTGRTRKNCKSGKKSESKNNKRHRSRSSSQGRRKTLNKKPQPHSMASNLQTHS
jgi:hypothetical protein